MLLREIAIAIGTELSIWMACLRQRSRSTGVALDRVALGASLSLELLEMDI
jgi:hypothetical protein